MPPTTPPATASAKAGQRPLPLSPSERAIITEACAERGIVVEGEPAAWPLAHLDAVIDALCDLMLRDGYHAEWEPTPLGREIEALVDKLDGLVTETVAA
jgi:hypothetical protein